MLAMDSRTLRLVSKHALSLTTIATVRRFDMLAPTVTQHYGNHPGFHHRSIVKRL
jgi:hypothetical protein